MNQDKQSEVIERLIAATWKWAQGCEVDGIEDRATVGDSYNEGCRDEVNKAAAAIAAKLAQQAARIDELTASRARTRDALEKMRSLPSLSTPSDDGPPYAADDWQAQGYASPGAEIDDMANVGRALMEALPEGYSYNDCPSEIVVDLLNQIDELKALSTPSEGVIERVRAEAFEEAAKLAEDANYGWDDNPEPSFEDVANAIRALARLSPLPLVEENQ